MKLHSIHLFSHDGRRRDLTFRQGLNIVTGRSSTGKSAIADIIEFCMGRSTFTIPEGAVRDKVSWYAVKYQFANEQVLVAKPAPETGKLSGSAVMIKRGAEVETPIFADLVVNADDDTVVSLLSRLVGIPDNRTEVPVHQSRRSFEANIKHTTYYLFQKQTVIANKDQLFYRQNETYQPQAIRDTLPILLGVSTHEKFALQSQIKEAERNLRIVEKRLEQEENTRDIAKEKALELLAEARAAGIVEPRGTAEGDESVLEALLRAASWTPSVDILENDEQIAALQDELVSLRSDRREIRAQIDAAKQFARGAGGFKAEAEEQGARLASIRAFPRNPVTNEWQWPFAEENLGLESPLADTLLGELRELEAEIDVVVDQRPRLDAYIAQQHTRLNELTSVIHSRETELAAALATNELLAATANRNVATSKVVGRISYFLDQLPLEQTLSDLEIRQQHLARRIQDLTQKIGADESEERMSSILSTIAKWMSVYTQVLEPEFWDLPIRLDVKRLTVVMDRIEGMILMERTGGGANHLAYHLAALLSLHRFAVESQRPIPRFLFLDQPTQVYFPSEKSYRDADGSIERTEMDADLEAVRTLFQVLRDFTEHHCPGFQIIVAEHANLREDWFQAALVESPWLKPPALVPDDWPLSRNATGH
jgi:hypothetical protein